MKGRKPDAMAVRRGQKDSFSITAKSTAYGLSMPEDIAADPRLSEIWKWICPETNNFVPEDLLLLRDLVTWQAVYEQARDMIISLHHDGKIAVVEKVGEKDFVNPDGTRPAKYRRNPALQVMKEAQAEIRALCDMLGLSPLARSRIGLIQSTTIKTAAETAAMFNEDFAGIEAEYAELIEAADD